MSLSELERAYGAPGEGSPEERLPPQDVAAEESALGAMLLSKDAIGECSEIIKPVDFYRPAHERIYEAVVDLFSRGEPVDAITVADELTKRGELSRIGGTAYLHQLIAGVPTAANAAFYAEIVAERAVLRRLVEAGTRIVQIGYGGGDVEEIVNTAQAEIYAVADKRGGEDYHALADLIQPTTDEIEHNASSTGEMVGVPTGFNELDELTNGLHPGQMVIVAARPAVGKALALDTPLPTPSGWTTMGEVRVGDQLLGADGRPTTVVAATEVMHDRPCYEVEFSDGSVITADAEHLWETSTRAERRGLREHSSSVRTTAEIERTLRCETADSRLNHSVALGGPLDLPQAELPLSPYVLGAWLGDGESAGARITSNDPEILVHLEAEGVEVRPQGNMLYSMVLPRGAVLPRVCLVCGSSFVPRATHVLTCGRSCGGRSKGLAPRREPSCPDCGSPSSGTGRCRSCYHDHGSVKALLRKAGVLGNKHIPTCYQRASESQRRALLAGLLDTDGTVSAQGCPQFTTTSDRLADDVYELVVGLGYRCGRSRKSVRGRSVQSSTAHTLTFSADEDVFRLERKRLAHKDRRARSFHRRDSRFITAVRRVGSVPVRCVQVDNDRQLFLAGRSMIPTHNSTFALDIARAAAIKHSLPTVVFSLEMSRTEITMRLLSAESEIPLQNMRKGNMRDRDWTRLAETQGRIHGAPLFIDDSPNMSLMEIRAKCRRLKQRNDLKLVVVDYLQLMSSGKRVESRQQEVAEFSRALKLLAKELEVPLIALSQLNRGPEQRTDKKPQMSDLRESGCLTADTRILRADTGAEVTMGELYESGERDVPVWSLDESLRYVRRHLTHVFPTGTRPVFRLTLTSGKTVRATENHPFLTYDGWKQLGDLRACDKIAVPRHLPAPDKHEPWSHDDQVLAMARDLDSGRFDALPDNAAHMSKRQIALLIGSLWARGGSVRLEDARIVVEWHGERGLADDMSRQLLRFGISTRLSTRAGLTVLSVQDKDDQRRFLREIAPLVDLGPDVAPALAFVEAGDTRAEPRPVLAEPAPLWQEMAQILQLETDGGALRTVAEVLDSEDLDLAAVNDVLFDDVVSVELDGVEEVFDATVLGNHNFVANGIAVHNSIEQDADVVILLHRESMYERESPREGEADVIVAKHRNGPTDTVVVAFQGHYSRFTNMASNF
ncbi:replicative DNA helicase [Ornithinimicrobium sp. CNJ-824]|uniref:replicative DNA helicase n=1 Tax=Ornithinimicrobium sp. CNJ-824 TaxID=1904966 RepID=UPI0009612F4C|nr:replicative DNA helicase [Ornithinimicrobium sp. CNJ-824]OLT19531.1 replicative DNA helicase [Ornithinimicrobium sp. CNJ-824]